MEPISIFRDNPRGVTERLARATVGIAGVGGVGSNVAWLLARAGLGRLIVADHDRVEPSNLNRQFYFMDQVSLPKVAALADNLARIRSGLDIVTHRTMLDRESSCRLFAGADLLVEALDRDVSKIMLLESWMTGLPGVPIVSCSGLAGEGRSEDVRIDRREGLTIVGDQTSDLSGGTLSSRVCLVASLMAAEVVSILLRSRPSGRGR